MVCKLYVHSSSAAISSHAFCQFFLFFIMYGFLTGYLGYSTPADDFLSKAPEDLEIVRAHLPCASVVHPYPSCPAPPFKTNASFCCLQGKQRNLFIRPLSDNPFHVPLRLLHYCCNYHLFN